VIRALFARLRPFGVCRSRIEKDRRSAQLTHLPRVTHLTLDIMARRNAPRDHEQRPAAICIRRAASAGGDAAPRASAVRPRQLNGSVSEASRAEELLQVTSRARAGAFRGSGARARAASARTPLRKPSVPRRAAPAYERELRAPSDRAEDGALHQALRFVDQRSMPERVLVRQ
jgi:hypothetical protein